MYIKYVLLHRYIDIGLQNWHLHMFIPSSVPINEAFYKQIMAITKINNYTRKYACIIDCASKLFGMAPLQQQTATPRLNFQVNRFGIWAKTWKLYVYVCMSKWLCNVSFINSRFLGFAGCVCVFARDRQCRCPPSPAVLLPIGAIRSWKAYNKRQ